MASANESLFIMNSDFPMPAQVANVTGTVFIPSGTQKTTMTTVLNIDPEVQFLRVSVKSSRNNILVPRFLDLYEPDLEFMAWAEKSSSNQVRCVVDMGNWEGGLSPSTTSDNLFTFYISGYKLP